VKIIAALYADFDRTFLDLPSRLNTELRGESVIRRTLRQLRQTKGLAGVHLLADASQEATARSAVAGLDVQLEIHQAGAPPWRSYVASGRKWSLDGWRGGLAGTMVCDEFNHPWLLDSLVRREGADAVVDVPAAAPLLDPRLLERLVRQYQQVREEVRLALVQSAPGLSAVVYRPDMLASLAGVSHPPGRAMAYRPDDPQHDIIQQPSWLAVDEAIARASGRCIADTSTSLERLARLLDALAPGNQAPPDALTISRWLLADRPGELDALPQEVEVEITTQDPLPDSPLRPRGRALKRTGEMSLELFKRLVDDLVGGDADMSARDDRLLVLGGFGDPLLHPQWPEFVRYARHRGVLGMAMRTPAISLDASAIDTLLECDLDVLNVLLDAASPETYARAHQADHFDQIATNVERLCSVQQERRCPRPLIVCEMVKTRDSLDEIEPFYDRWMRKTGSAVIAGASHYSGQWPDRAVVRMAPPTRFPCLRLQNRAMVLADGRVTLCDQDFKGAHAVGSLHQSSLSALWRGAAWVNVRQNHALGHYHSLPLCRDCDEWHRP